MYLTIEDLINATGYSKNTIYSHSVGLCIKPIRGKIEGNSGKGLYTREALDKLEAYKQAIEKGMTKEEAYKEVRGRYGCE